MSSQESRILWCLVEDDPIPYYVRDIPIGANVTQLKELITQSIECLNNIKPHHLKLSKPNVIIPIDPDDSLRERLEALDGIDAYSRKLSSGERVRALFPEPHSEDNLHIVVQCSRKRSRSGTEEGCRAAKRKEIEGDVPDIQTRCVAIYGAIKAMPDNLDLSNPSTFKFIALPFPSLLLMPSQRLEKKAINGIDHFEYMGRSHFHELQRLIESEDFLHASESLYLYGTSGTGKSHLLAALAYHLIRAGKRVIYIPDCSTLYLGPAEQIWKALKFAFYNSAALGSTGDSHDVDAFIRSISQRQDLYIIVDQANALEIAEDDSRRAPTLQAKHWLNALRLNHPTRYIFSASTNENSDQDADRKQSRISVFRILGGMSLDETNEWFTCHDDRIPQLSAEQHQRVEYLTGSIPLLLRCLFNMTNFDETEFRNMPDLRNLGLEVDTFGSSKLESLGPLSKERYLQIMRACVRGDVVSFNNLKLYDLRHFYVDEKGIGRFTCGIALETMTSILQSHDDAPFLNDYS